VTREDYRGWLALGLLVLLGWTVMTGNSLGVTTFGPLAGWAAGWYFAHKETRKR
jgi:hypothetical protein